MATNQVKGSPIDKDRFEVMGASVGTWFYKLEVTEEEKNTILRNQEIRKELEHLVRDMDVTGTISNHWIKSVLERILLYGIKAK
ncbi:MAG: hypothetical protein KGL95_00165 [Patescibacteria group bacterium]|nr:hypothetical protein [Patescibacteria group bacterium]